MLILALEKLEKRSDMDRQKLIEKIKEKQKERLANKPMYPIDSLYVGEIIKIHHVEPYWGKSIFDSGEKFRYSVVKKFAIFKQVNICTYLHVATNFALETTERSLEVGEYVLNERSKKEFAKKLQIYMLDKGYNKKTKLSLNEIKEIEYAVNKELYTIMPQDEAFW